MAPSSHNSQPWKFRIQGDAIHIFADDDRWLRVADPDKRELFISVGCAVENLLIAAEHFGFHHEVRYFPEGEGGAAAVVTFKPGAGANTRRDPDLFMQIPLRQTNHKTYQEKRIPPEAMAVIHECMFEEGFWLFATNEGPYPLYSEVELRQRIDDMITRADAIQLTDDAYKKELASWIGRGAFGSPWLMAKIGQLAVTYLNISKGQTKKDSEMLLSAPSLVAMVSGAEDRKSQVIAGQIFERIALTAAKLGIAIHPMSQILEVPEIKSELHDLLNVPQAKAEITGLLDDEPVFTLQTFRLGYAEPEEGHTPRRPLDEVLMEK